MGFGYGVWLMGFWGSGVGVQGFSGLVFQTVFRVQSVSRFSGLLSTGLEV